MESEGGDLRHHGGQEDRCGVMEAVGWSAWGEHHEDVGRWPQADRRLRFH